MAEKGGDMAKRKAAKRSVASKSLRRHVPNSLEDPVHNVVGYVVLLVLALVVFWLVWTLKGQ